MCLLLFAYECHPQYPLLLLANRDEFYARPSAAAAPWADNSGIIAGRDLEAGGTWLGIASGGRVAAVTNVREPQRPAPSDAQSRGDIPTAFLTGRRTPQQFATQIEGDHYRGFNALLFDIHSSPRLICAGNRHNPFPMAPGVHGISNGAADAPWPKVVRGKSALTGLIQQLLRELTREPPVRLNNSNFVDPALALLRDKQQAPSEQLPRTGVSSAMELALSPIFVELNATEMPAGGYGTRASTLVAVDKSGHSRLWEQSFVNGNAIDPLRELQIK